MSGNIFKAKYFSIYPYHYPVILLLDLCLGGQKAGRNEGNFCVREFITEIYAKVY